MMFEQRERPPFTVCAFMIYRFKNPHLTETELLLHTFDALLLR